MGKGRCFFHAIRTWEFMVFFFDLRYEWNIENVTKGYTCRELNVYIYMYNTYCQVGGYGPRSPNPTESAPKRCNAFPRSTAMRCRQMALAAHHC